MKLKEYYNQQAELQKLGLLEHDYICALFENEYDYELEDYTIEQFLKEVDRYSEYFLETSDKSYYDIPDDEDHPIIDCIFSIDTDCRHVFWRLAKTHVNKVKL